MEKLEELECHKSELDTTQLNRIGVVFRGPQEVCRDVDRSDW